MPFLPTLIQPRSASSRINSHSAATSLRSVGSAPMETRAIHLPSSSAESGTPCRSNSPARTRPACAGRAPLPSGRAARAARTRFAAAPARALASSARQSRALARASRSAPPGRLPARPRNSPPPQSRCFGSQACFRMLPESIARFSRPRVVVCRSGSHPCRLRTRGQALPPLWPRDSPHRAGGPFDFLLSGVPEVARRHAKAEA